MTKRLDTAELLELIIREERSTLVSALHLPESTASDYKLLQKVVKEMEISATTLLATILDMRRPVVQMLSFICNYIGKRELSGRPTTRVVALDSANTSDFKLVFDEAMTSAIATALDLSKRSLASWADIGRGVKALDVTLRSVLRRLRGIEETSNPALDESLRLKESDPRQREIVQIQRRLLPSHRVFNAKDGAGLRRVTEEVQGIFALLSLRSGRRKDGSPPQIWSGIQDLNSGLRDRSKQFLATSPRAPQSVHTAEWQRLQETAMKLREDVASLAEFELAGSQIADFLSIGIWKEADRVYELWILCKMLELLEAQGLALELLRADGGVWQLKYSLDRTPVAVLRGGSACLYVFYQLYVKGESPGAMPDIAVLAGRGTDSSAVLVMDPKYGRSFTAPGLRAVACRYAEKFSPTLSVVMNFFEMDKVDNAGDGTNRRVMAGVQPESAALGELEDCILGAVQEYLPQRLCILFDVSGSTAGARDRMEAALRAAIESNQLDWPCDVRAFADGVTSFSAKTAEELLQLLPRPGGATDLSLAIKAVVAVARHRRRKVEIWLFTDGGIDLAPEYVNDSVLENAFVSMYVVGEAVARSKMKQLADRLGWHYHDFL